MKKTLSYFTVLFILAFQQGWAQGENWDVYLAQYEKGAGSTMLNLALKEQAPMRTYPFVVVTGVTFSDCSADGFPTQEEFVNLYAISDSVQSILNLNHHIIFAGTFTYQCQRLDYVYIDDTTGVRASLNKLYQSRFRNYIPYISVKEDAKWDAYLSFLYPNEDILDYMGNEKVVEQLQEAGDKLDKPRVVDHWIYFEEESGLRCFISYALANGYKVEESGKESDGLPRKYKLRIARVDSVVLAEISKVTSSLRSQAKICKGDYDGWETVVVK